MSKDTTEHIHRLLRDRYMGAEWAYMVEVPDGTSMNKQRTADAVAIGCWKKNWGLMYGFEVKSSRSDWVKELETPEKSQGWRNVCTSFFLVAGRGVVNQLAEVPPEWGFLEVSRDGGVLKMRKQPAHVKRESVPLNLVGAMLRRGIDIMPHGVARQLEDVQKDTKESYRRGREDGERMSSCNAARIEELEKTHHELTMMLGKSPDRLRPEDLAIRIMKMAQTHGLAHIGTSLDSAYRQLGGTRDLIARLEERLVAAAAEFGKIDQGAAE